MAEIFPEHAELFTKPTIAEAFHAIKERSIQLEIQKNVDMLREIFSWRLPKDLIVCIAIMTGDDKFNSQFISIYHMTHECIKMVESRYEMIGQARLVKKMTPSVSTLIREHGLFMSVIRNDQ